MADGTKIEWTDATVNAINGCTRVSPGCGGPGPHGGCYAERLAGTRMRSHPTREGLTRQTSAGPRWTGDVRLNEAALLQPLKWAKRRMIFWNAHGDMFHDAVPNEWIDRCIAVMALTPHHIHQVLTKRSARMRDYMSTFEQRPEAFGEALAHVVQAAGLTRERGIDAIEAMTWPLPNVWLGVSVEDQQRANERIPDLMATPAAVRWLSCEPLLDFISLEEAWHGESALDSECWGDCGWCKAGHPPMWNCQREWTQYEPGAPQRSGLDWIVVGGESGPNARPMELEAARSLRDQCADAGVPFFFKQWGQWLPCGQKTASGEIWSNGSGHSLHAVKSMTGRYLDGRYHDDMPVMA